MKHINSIFRSHHIEIFSSLLIYRRLVSYKSKENLTLYGCDWSPSCPDSFTAKDISTGIRSIGMWVGMSEHPFPLWKRKAVVGPEGLKNKVTIPLI